jgi:ABC-type multidrug transport system ATPase subunit
LSLARALLREPSLLILDEATSALDTVTERQVHAHLRALRCTRIVVAHRLSTVVEADKIVVLEAGKIAGIGTHARLFTSCPAYRELVRAQADAPEGRVSVSVSASAPVAVASGVLPLRTPRLGGAAALAARLRAKKPAAVASKPTAVAAKPTPIRRPTVLPLRVEAK